jgi:hypothetical protein
MPANMILGIPLLRYINGEAHAVQLITPPLPTILPIFLLLHLICHNNRRRRIVINILLQFQESMVVIPILCMITEAGICLRQTIDMLNPQICSVMDQ